MEIQNAYDVSLPRDTIDASGQTFCASASSVTLTRFRSYPTTRNGKPTIPTDPHLHKKDSTLTDSVLELAGLVDSKDLADSVVEQATLGICSNHYSALHSVVVRVETHSAAAEAVEVLDNVMSKETIWKRPSLYHSWKLPWALHVKSTSPPWLIVNRVRALDLNLANQKRHVHRVEEQVNKPFNSKGWSWLPHVKLVGVLDPVYPETLGVGNVKV